jgi:hypothetical protein
MDRVNLHRTGRPSTIDDLNHPEKTYSGIERIFSALSRAKAAARLSRIESLN